MIHRHRRQRFIVLLLVSGVLVAAAPPAASAGTCTWRGAGTAGKTATDAADTTTLWLTPANWLGGIVPAAGDTAYLTLANSGCVTAQTASVGALYLNGTSPQGVFHLVGGVTLTTTGDLWRLRQRHHRQPRPGRWGQRRPGQPLPGLQHGKRGPLHAGRRHADRRRGLRVIGFLGTATFTQTGGLHAVTVLQSSGVLGRQRLVHAGRGHAGRRRAWQHGFRVHRLLWAWGVHPDWRRPYRHRLFAWRCCRAIAGPTRWERSAP